jgi:UPF0716 protein FxsA
MPFLLLLAIFIIVPFAELYVILQVVGPALGAPLTVLLLAADSLLGAYLFRTQGRAVWRRMNDELRQGRMPHREVQDGVAIVFGGAFLITPGFLTDIVGILLLFPPTRAVIRRFVVRRLSKRVQATVVTGSGRSRTPSDFDVEGTATEYPAPDPRRLER